MLYAGVTSVLVAQSGVDEERLVRNSVAGLSAAPHLFLAGPGRTAPGGHPIPFVRALVPWPLRAVVVSSQPTAATEAEAKRQAERIGRIHHPPLFKTVADLGALTALDEVWLSGVRLARQLVSSL